MNRVKVFIIFILACAFQISAQENPFPNELKDYEFFGVGRLKNLQLTGSSKDDVRKVFGAHCEKACSYDETWSISFDYFDEISIMESRNDKEEKLIYKLDSKYLGKLRSIEIRPKKQISFANIAFPRVFQKLLVASSGFNKDKNRMNGDEAFQDLSGLTYEICRINCDHGGKELVLIRYEIPKALNNKLFIPQK